MKELPLFILSLFFTLSAFGQQPEYPDSGFTNKAEAKNITVNGVQEGKWIIYNISRIDSNKPDTLEYLLAVLKNGRNFGVMRAYYMNGEIQSTVPYKDGLENGMVKEYYKDGKLKFSIQFINGNGGAGTFYDEKGNIIKEIKK
jgi:antitoxin component YwqK of YwqJK toxin-antitoxin module